MNMKNYLGIDWGEKEIGVALAHAETRLALALTILPNDDLLWEKLAATLQENEAGAVIIGIPHYKEEGTMNKAKHFSQEFQKHFPDVKVVLSDEMFTSKMATERLRENDKKGQKDHAEAARILLSEWLEHGK